MSKRKTITLTDAMTESLSQFGGKWNVNESEAMRRLFALGAFTAEELLEGTVLYSQRKGEKDIKKLVFADL